MILKYDPVKLVLAEKKASRETTFPQFQLNAMHNTEPYLTGEPVPLPG